MEQSSFPVTDTAKYEPVYHDPTGSIPHDERTGVRDRPVCIIQCNLLYERLDTEPYPGCQMATSA